jgi:SAM-dependent methyltransferase
MAPRPARAALTIVGRVPSPDVRTFVLANLPAPPARVLEIGAGDGELAQLLSAVGYRVVAIDPEPGAEHVLPVALAELDEPESSFDAAVAIVSLHHVDPLDDSCERLGEMLRPGATLLVDEFDIDLFDERAESWWLEQRHALDAAVPISTLREKIAHMRAELHPLARIHAVLEAHFDVGPPLRGSYLYRWHLDEALRSTEEELIVSGDLPAVGARLVGRRR